MNSVNLVGRLTRDPDVKYTSGSEPMAVARFSIAIDRPMKEKEADFPSIVVFGRQAENCEKFIHKGSRVGITGRIQTGSYEKDGRKVYTTDVVARNVEFLDSKSEETTTQQGFQQIDDAAPF